MITALVSMPTRAILTPIPVYRARRRLTLARQPHPTAKNRALTSANAGVTLAYSGSIRVQKKPPYEDCGELAGGSTEHLVQVGAGMTFTLPYAAPIAGELA